MEQIKPVKIEDAEEFEIKGRGTILLLYFNALSRKELFDTFFGKTIEWKEELYTVRGIETQGVGPYVKAGLLIRKNKENGTA